MSVKFCEVNNTSLANQSKNKTLKKKYDANPRCFWNDLEVRDTFPSFLVSTVIFIFSILAASANCERAFSRMEWMVAARRPLQLTMLTSGSHSAISYRKSVDFWKHVENGKLSERNWTKIYSNERIFKWTFVHHKSLLSCSVFFEKLVEFCLNFNISTKILSLTGAGKILPAR